jgi:integrase
MLLAKPSSIKTVINHPALAVEDAPEWFRLLRRRHGVSCRALEFLALTWTRSGEVRGAAWAEVDLNRAVWTIPAKRTKTSDEHSVPLAKEALAILRNMPRLDGTDLIFPGTRGGKLSDMSLSAVMRRLHKSEVENDLSVPSRDITLETAGWLDPQSRLPAVPHGLRSTARNWAGRNLYNRELAELALGHRIGNRIEQTYMRDSLIEQRREMMQDWAEYLYSNIDERLKASGLRLA